MSTKSYHGDVQYHMTLNNISSVVFRIFSNLGPPNNLLQVKTFFKNWSSKPFVISSYKLKILSGHMKVWRPMSTTLYILVDHQNTVGWQVVLKYMPTPQTHYFLESSGQAAYMETCQLIHSHRGIHSKISCWPKMPMIPSSQEMSCL